MAPFVVLALALSAVSFGAAIVAAVQLRRGVSRLRATVQATTRQLQPLLDELSAEAAVTSTEVEALQERLAARRDSRQG